MNGRESLIAALHRLHGPRWLWREISFRWKWRKHPEVIAIVSPHPAPPEAVERLRKSVESGDWDTP